MDIPQDRLLPQDLVDIYDHGSADEPHAEPVKHRMHASDARHAMSVEPERWMLDPVKPEPAPAVIDDKDEDELDV